MAKITLVQWAKKHTIAWGDAINWARRGKLKTAKKEEVVTLRWLIDDDDPPPCSKN